MLPPRGHPGNVQGLVGTGMGATPATYWGVSGHHRGCAGGHQTWCRSLSVSQRDVHILSDFETSQWTFVSMNNGFKCSETNPSCFTYTHENVLFGFNTQCIFQEGSHCGLWFCSELDLDLVRTSLVIQWLRLVLPMQAVWVQPLVGELRSHMLPSNWALAPQLENPGGTMKDPHDSKIPSASTKT